jgi:cytochrome c553
MTQVMSKTIIAAAGVLAVLAATPVMAADGKALFADKGCTACHGEDARTPFQEGFPKLGGQNADYVFQQLKDFKAGLRTNAQAETMKSTVDDIAEPDLRALADYLGSLGPFVPATAQIPADHPGKPLFMTKTCVACHGKDGKKPLLKSYPALAGQDKAYLVRQMLDIGAATRSNGGTAAMQPVMHLVSNPEIDAIADFLANVK